MLPQQSLLPETSLVLCFGTRLSGIRQVMPAAVFMHSTLACLVLTTRGLACRWSGLYPLMSLINHSCCPNSLYYFVKDAAMLRAGCNLKKGQTCWACNFCLCSFEVIQLHPLETSRIFINTNPSQRAWDKGVLQSSNKFADRGTGCFQFG